MHVHVHAQLLLATNHYLAVFFVLPSMPTRRSQRLMIVYLVVLSQFAVLVLFFGQEQTGLSALWGVLLANGIVVVVKIVATKAFGTASLSKAVLFQTLEKVQRQRLRRRREGSWDLVLRQTVPRGQRAAAKACSLWQGDSLFTLTEPTEAQFCDTHCLYVVPPLYRVKSGKDVHACAMVCKLVLTQPSGSMMSLEWRQSSAFSAPAVQGFEVRLLPSYHPCYLVMTRVTHLSPLLCRASRYRSHALIMHSPYTHHALAIHPPCTYHILAHVRLLLPFSSWTCARVRRL